MEMANALTPRRGEFLTGEGGGNSFRGECGERKDTVGFQPPRDSIQVKGRGKKGSNLEGKESLE